jgi:hypothetical protein
MQFGLDMLRPGPQKQKAAASLRRLRRKPQLRITVETARPAKRSVYLGPGVKGLTMAGLISTRMR